MQPSKRWNILPWRLKSLVVWERSLLTCSNKSPFQSFQYVQVRYLGEIRGENKGSKLVINMVTPEKKKLVYLHCSSIFKGEKSQIRKLKKITQLLNKHKTSIKILTNEFPLGTIATVAKSLLEQRIFELQPRARLHFPELFEPSKTQEAQREASEAEVARIEAAAVQETAVTSDEEWKTRDGQQSLKVAQLEATKQDAHDPAAEQW